MLEHYDFSNAIKNPFAELLNENRTIMLNDDVIDHSFDLRSAAIRLNSAICSEDISGFSSSGSGSLS